MLEQVNQTVTRVINLRKRKRLATKDALSFHAVHALICGYTHVAQHNPRRHTYVRLLFPTGAVLINSLRKT